MGGYQYTASFSGAELKYLWFAKKLCPECDVRMYKEKETISKGKYSYTTVMVNGKEKYIHSAGMRGYSTMSNSYASIPDKKEIIYFFECPKCKSKHSLEDLANKRYPSKKKNSSTQNIETQDNNKNKRNVKRNVKRRLFQILIFIIFMILAIMNSGFSIRLT